MKRLMDDILEKKSLYDETSVRIEQLGELHTRIKEGQRADEIVRFLHDIGCDDWSYFEQAIYSLEIPRLRSRELNEPPIMAVMRYSPKEEKHKLLAALLMMPSAKLSFVSAFGHGFSTPFDEPIRQRDAYALQAFLPYCDVGLWSANSGGPLLDAVVHNFPEGVQLLLEAGAPMHACSRQMSAAKNLEENPFVRAFEADNKEILDIFANFDVSDTVHRVDNFWPAQKAISTGDEARLRFLFERCKLDASKTFKSVYRSAFPLANVCQNVAQAQFLARFDNEYNVDFDARTHEGETPLFTAVRNNDDEYVQWLLDRGVDATVLNLAGESALHVVGSDSERIATLLIEGGCPLDAVDSDGRTSLRCANQNLHVNVARCLYAAAAPLVGANDLPAMIIRGDEQGVRALFAAEPNDEERVRLANTSLTIKNQSYTPLLLATECGHVECVRFLAENGANVNESREWRWLLPAMVWLAHHHPVQVTPLQLACLRQHERFMEMVDILLNCGANIQVHMKTFSPLHATMMCDRSVSLFHRLLRAVDSQILRQMIFEYELGINVSKKLSLIEFALVTGGEHCADFVFALLDAGVQYSRGHICQHVFDAVPFLLSRTAAKKRRKTTMCQLLRLGAYIDTRYARNMPYLVNVALNRGDNLVLARHCVARVKEVLNHFNIVEDYMIGYIAQLVYVDEHPILEGIAVDRLRIRPDSIVFLADEDHIGQLEEDDDRENDTRQRNYWLFPLRVFVKMARSDRNAMQIRSFKRPKVPKINQKSTRK